MADETDRLARLRAEVREAFASHAQTAHRVAETLYPPGELAGLPSRAVELALGFGNPVLHAAPKPGETVLDLGCGGGIDSLLAARRVRPGGRVLGLDLSPEMLSEAEKNIRDFPEVSLLSADGEDIPFRMNRSTWSSPTVR